MKTFLPIIFISLYTSLIQAMIFEFSGDFGYDKQKYGATKTSSIVSRSYSGGVSIYLFDLTAIDITASQSKEVNSNNSRYTITGTGYDAIARQDRIESNVYGVGIKQMLAPRGSFLVPMIGFGYARQITYSDYDATYLNTSSNAYYIYRDPIIKQQYNSVYATFMLQFKLTERLSLKTSVKTLFQAFKFNEAKDNLKYSAGFSWLF